ncbi:MAG: hypothetical protein JWS12_594 [Candidatus Saccharibacteria bacterium]|nr:hypothetical protein [Candidatus Saccharibacteria bacterium]
MKKTIVFSALGLVLVIVLVIFIRSLTPDPTPQLPSPPLKDLAAQHGLALGNFAILSRLSEKPYADILTSQFNFALADNTPNWYFTDGGLRPSPTSYNFSQLDQVVRFASVHSMPVQAHHYVWGEEKWLPSWLTKGHYSSQQLLDIMRDHILTVGGRYRGQIREWSVVNEAFTRGQHTFGLHDWWADNIGSQSYIDKAFIWAHQADPAAKLILNDFNNEGLTPVSNSMYDYIKAARARGVPIDGLGMQMHIDGTHPPTKDEVVANMKRFGELGVQVYVTEFDVNMNDVPADTAAKDNIEGKIYYEMTRACIESTYCHSFALLGITDKETWYNYLGLPNARPLPFDRHYHPKPAFFALRSALEQP